MQKLILFHTYVYLALFQDRMTLMIGMSGGLQNKDKLIKSVKTELLIPILELNLFKFDCAELTVKSFLIHEDECTCTCMFKLFS